MKTIARILEIALGLFFLASAGAKAMNIEGFGVQISSYGIVKDPSLVHFGAVAVLTVETAIGASFLSGRTLKGLTYATAGLLTLIFTGLIFYGWQFKGLEDCGCFGDYIKMGPKISIFKNIVLLGLLGIAAWKGTGSAEVDPASPVQARRTALAAIGIVVILGIGLSQNESAPTTSTAKIAADPAKISGPFSKYVFESEVGTVDLGKGAHMVALLSATCEHCMDSVPMLNELAAIDGVPPVVGLMLGEPDDIRDFEVLTEAAFPLFAIPSLEFMQFIDSAPPKLIQVRDGVPGKSWEWLEKPPAAAEIGEALAAGP